MNINFAIEKVQGGVLEKAREEKADRQEIYDYNSNLIKEAFSNVIEAYISEFADSDEQMYVTDAYTIIFDPDKEILMVTCNTVNLIKNITLRFEALGQSIKGKCGTVISGQIEVYDYIYEYIMHDTVNLVKSLVDALSKYSIHENSISTIPHTSLQNGCIMFNIDLADWYCLSKAAIYKNLM